MEILPNNANMDDIRAVQATAGNGGATEVNPTYFSSAMDNTMTAGTRSLLRHLTPERGFDLIRIYLGVGLAVRGVLLFLDPTWIGSLMSANSDSRLAPLLIAIGHMAGGALLGLGLFTRVAAAIQVVPVLGALVMLHSREDLASQNQSLEFSALVLVMLIFYACFGSGQWSLDHQCQMRLSP